MSERDDLDMLASFYPDWDFGVIWTTRASGPDVRQLYARQDRVKLVAFDAPGLERLIKDHSEVSKKSE